MHQSFAVMLPAIKEAFGISPIQIGALMTAKEIAMGVSSLPGGVISDRLKRYRGIIMAACMALFGLSWLLIGMASIYPHLIVGLVFVSIATSVWHLPSMAEISRRFSDRKGASLAIFGIGGSFGDIFGPVITGILLGLLAWQSDYFHFSTDRRLSLSELGDDSYALFHRSPVCDFRCHICKCGFKTIDPQQTTPSLKSTGLRQYSGQTRQQAFSKTRRL